MEGGILYDEAFYNTPGAVRSSLTPSADGGAFLGVAPETKLPGLCGSATWAFVTTWASLGSSAAPFDLSLGGQARQRLHLPIVWVDPCPMDVAIIFRPQPTKLAVLYLAKRAGPVELHGPGTVLGASVSEGLFPEGGQGSTGAGEGAGAGAGEGAGAGAEGAGS